MTGGPGAVAAAADETGGSMRRECTPRQASQEAKLSTTTNLIGAATQNYLAARAVLMA
jgi:hypothetical protein